MRYKIERYYPLAISVILIIALVSFKNGWRDFPALIDKLSDNSIGLSTTLVGFFLTILTLVNSIETRRMDFVRSGGLYPRLLKYLNQSIRANMVLIALSFIVKYIEHRTQLWLQYKSYNILDYAFVFFLLFTLLVSVRFINVFVHLLADPKQPDK
ncbi:MAG TPA: hypothetical protein VGM30_04815 [Puia sp.]|jgi:glycogen debranching enzyme